jgi:serine/threonine protein kinase
MRVQEDILHDKLLGEGSFGCVYEASLAEAGPRFAVKLIKLEDNDDEADRLSAIADMEAEATVQCALGGHPGIVQARRPAPLRLAFEGDALDI